ncbi:MAG: hypothetical protein ABIH41_06870 [Nanoarchaeota archaeon]
MTDNTLLSEWERFKREYGGKDLLHLLEELFRNHAVQVRVKGSDNTFHEIHLVKVRSVKWIQEQVGSQMKMTLQGNLDNTDILKAKRPSWLTIKPYAMTERMLIEFSISVEPNDDAKYLLVLRACPFFNEFHPQSWEGSIGQVIKHTISFVQTQMKPFQDQYSAYLQTLATMPTAPTKLTREQHKLLDQDSPQDAEYAQEYARHIHNFLTEMHEAIEGQLHAFIRRFQYNKHPRSSFLAIAGGREKQLVRYAGCHPKDIIILHNPFANTMPRPQVTSTDGIHTAAWTIPYRIKDRTPPEVLIHHTITLIPGIRGIDFSATRPEQLPAAFRPPVQITLLPHIRLVCGDTVIASKNLGTSKLELNGEEDLEELDLTMIRNALINACDWLEKAIDDASKAKDVKPA